ncbi:hypothetical protein [Brevibacillus brevis]|uniref:hypothetical protein n=1 Tax=Brevibacillus brevis TaxID=1393 RepID=UPI001EDC7192|nr:hypothetical protein [Brevibacillus brevis]
MEAHDQTRAEAFERVERELAFMSLIQPTYVLFHYPKPVILDDRVDWNVWRFHDCRDYVWEQAYSEEGWAPIEDYLTIIRKENPHVKIMFEHRSDLVTDGQLERCYRWVEQLLSEPDESTSSNNSI